MCSWYTDCADNSIPDEDEVVGMMVVVVPLLSVVIVVATAGAIMFDVITNATATIAVIIDVSTSNNGNGDDDEGVVEADAYVLFFIPIFLSRSRFQARTL